jgi:hypothetical protein
MIYTHVLQRGGFAVKSPLDVEESIIHPDASRRGVSEELNLYFWQDFTILPES